VYVSVRAHSVQQWIRSHYPVAGLNDRSVIIGLVRAENGVWQWTDGTVFVGDASQLYEHYFNTQPSNADTGTTASQLITM
jgi:hypothetical protein